MTFQHVHKGQPFYETADFRNAVVDLLRRDFAARKAVSSISGIAGREGIGHYRSIHIYAETPLTSRAIFTIRSYGTYFGQMYPTAASIQVKATTPPDAVYVVVDDHGLGAGAEGMCEIVGDEKAHMVYYDDADGTPVLGGIVGVKPNTYKVSTKYSGLNVVSEPDTIKKLIWVTRNYFYEFVKAKANECHYPGIDVNNGHRLYTYNSTACEWQDQYTLDITVKDPQGLVMMLPDEIHWAIKHRCGADDVQYEFLNEFGLIRLALTTEEISIDGSGDANIIGDEVGSGSGAGECPIIVYNVICDMEIPAYTYVYVKYFPERSRWEIISTCSAANQIVLLEVQNCLQPGGSTYAKIFNIIGGLLTDMGLPQVALYDFDFDNFLLPGEFTWAVKDQTNNDYYPIGSKGLQRTAVITNVQSVSGSVDPRLEKLCTKVDVLVNKVQEGSGEECEGTASSCTISDVCPPFATWDRKWKVGEKVVVWFDKGQRKWYLHSYPRAHHVKAVLESALCWNDPVVNTSQETYMDMAYECSYAANLDAAVTNPFYHQGHAGDDVLLQWDDYEEEWVVYDVKKHIYSQPVADGDIFIQLDGCNYIEGRVLPDVGLETCQTPDWENQIPLAASSVVENVEYIGSGNCGTLRITTNSVCGFGSGAGQEQDVLTFEETEAITALVYEGSSETGSGEPGDITCGAITYQKKTFCVINPTLSEVGNIMSFRAINVVTDISDDGTCVYATYQAICVADYDEDEVALPIICCQDCESGSGSSGS